MKKISFHTEHFFYIYFFIFFHPSPTRDFSVPVGVWSSSFGLGRMFLVFNQAVRNYKQRWTLKIKFMVDLIYSYVSKLLTRFFSYLWNGEIKHLLQLTLKTVYNCLQIRVFNCIVGMIPAWTKIFQNYLPLNSKEFRTVNQLWNYIEIEYHQFMSF